MHLLKEKLTLKNNKLRIRFLTDFIRKFLVILVIINKTLTLKPSTLNLRNGDTVKL